MGRLQEVVLSEQSRAREEAEKRLNKLMKNLDHLERARREEEAPLLEANHTKQASQGLSSASGLRAQSIRIKYIQPAPPGALAWVAGVSRSMPAAACNLGCWPVWTQLQSAPGIGAGRELSVMLSRLCKALQNGFVGALSTAPICLPALQAAAAAAVHMDTACRLSLCLLSRHCCCASACLAARQLCAEMSGRGSA